MEGLSKNTQPIKVVKRGKDIFIFLEQSLPIKVFKKNDLFTFIIDNHYKASVEIEKPTKKSPIRIFRVIDGDLSMIYRDPKPEAKPSESKPKHSRLWKSLKVFTYLGILAGIILFTAQKYNDVVNDPVLQLECGETNPVLCSVAQKLNIDLEQPSSIFTNKFLTPPSLNNRPLQPIQQKVVASEKTSIYHPVLPPDINYPAETPEFRKYCDALVYKYRSDPSVSIIKIPKIEVCTTVKKGDPEKILKTGAWLDDTFSMPANQDFIPTVISAHRFGYVWWSPEFKKHNSFASINKLQADDVVFLYRSGLVYTYLVNQTDVNKGKIPAKTDLALYSCIGFNKDERYFVYLRQYKTGFAN